MLISFNSIIVSIFVAQSHVCDNTMKQTVSLLFDVNNMENLLKPDLETNGWEVSLRLRCLINHSVRIITSFSNISETNYVYQHINIKNIILNRRIYYVFARVWIGQRHKTLPYRSCDSIRTKNLRSPLLWWTATHFWVSHSKMCLFIEA